MQPTHALHPLSSVQREIWFDQALYPDAPVYNIAGMNRIPGVLDRAIFQEAITRLVQETEILRLMLTEKDGVPWQSFPAMPQVDLCFRDFSTAEDPLQAAQSEIRQQVDQPFRLFEEPLFRFTLFKLSGTSHIWLQVFHHLLVDGSAVALLTQRAGGIYRSLLRGEPVPSKQGVSYLDFVASDATYRASDSFERHRHYWQTKFSSLPDPLLAPKPAYRNQSAIVPGAIHTWFLPRARYAQLETLAQAFSVTIFHVLLGLCYVVFTRMHERNECVIGLPVLNRHTSAFKQTIGLFSSVIPARFSHGTRLDFVGLMQAIAKTLREDYRNQRFPVSEINHLAGVYQAGRKRLFDLSLSFIRGDYATEFGPGNFSRINFVKNSYEQLPLSIYVGEYAEGQDIQFDFSYNQAFFDAEEITQIERRILCLLEDVLAQPHRSISELNILLPEERRKLLFDWNNLEEPPRAPEPDSLEGRGPVICDGPPSEASDRRPAGPCFEAAEACVHELFEAHVRRTPEATAVVFENEVLSYAELNTRANRLAHTLIALGITPDDRVAIALERSPAMIVALLATLKAGGAYVPLDPAYPPTRLAFMLEDSGARVLLTQESLRAQFAPNTCHLLLVDTAWAGDTGPHDGNPPSSATSRHLAYVIYTSGSTGKPKGVAIEHRSIAHHCQIIRTFYELSTQDRVFQFASFSCDMSVEQILPTLGAGAALVVPPPDLLSTEELDLCLHRHGVTVLNLPPAFFRLWAVTNGPRINPRLRLIILGGEALTPEVLSGRANWPRPGPRIFNAYGPTEATITTTLHEVPEGVAGTSVPIGRPLPQHALYILDLQQQLTPIGVPGELHIAGLGLARGYLNRPELTAERFIPNPFSRNPGSRLYKTGDLVRYRSNGEIEFLGRLDHQVKIHGFRIELGEIEAALVSHSSIRAAVVVARQNGNCDRRLVAYLVAGNKVSETDAPLPARPSTGELRSYLKARLPVHMLPAAFVYLPAFPLTPNGKIDRQALPEPEADALGTTTRTTPSDALEEILVGLWGRLLNQNTLGRHDNFFELGGHSLLATQLATRIRDTLGFAVPVRWIFEAPTVAELAARIRPALAHGQSVTTAAQEIPLAPRDAPLPLSFGQQRLWFLTKLEGPSPAYNMPGSLRLSGTLDIEALRAALSAIVRRHESLRTCLVTHAGELQQIISPDACLKVPLHDLRQAADPQAEATRLAQEEALTPFNLATEIPVRALLLQREDNAWTLLLTLHHTAADGWSIEIFFRELGILYSAFRAGKPSPLPELGLQYADYALWQHHNLTSERLAVQREIWRQRLAGAPACLNLPTDRPRPPRQSYRGAVVTFAIDADLSGSVRQLGQRAGATLFMTLLTAWATLLGRYSGEEDVVIGSPMANRTMSAVEPLIGFFVTTLPIRADLTGNPSFGELLRRLRQVCLEAYVYQETPLELLVEASGVRRSLSHAPLFQVLFVLQTTAKEPLVLPDLKVELMETESTMAKFDLTLSITPVDGVLAATLEYATDLFNPSTIEQMGGDFVQILRAVVADPQRPIGELGTLCRTQDVPCSLL